MSETEQTMDNSEDTIENKINAYFDHLIQLLNNRRAALLSQLCTKRSVNKTQKEHYTLKREEMIETRELLQNKFRSNRLKSLEEIFLTNLDAKLDELECEQSCEGKLNFEVDSGYIERSIVNLGAIIKDSSFDYSELQQPICVVGKEGDNSDLVWPQCVAINEHSGNIFVSDYGNSCVRVFTESAAPLDEIETGHIHGPYGIAFGGDNMYITGYNTHSILQYRYPGPKFVRRVGKKGSGKLEFNKPTQLTVNSDGDVYICDYWNHRITVLTSQLKFRKQIKRPSLLYPCDVKVSGGNLFLLTDSDPCMHILTPNGDILQSFISRGDKLQVGQAFCFCLDVNNNILISDMMSHSIKVFNQNGKLIHTIGQQGDEKGMFQKPRGLCLNKNNNLVCVSQNSEYKLQIF